MSECATTRLSTKGQIVIPEEVRERLGLLPGTEFVVVGDGDTVVLKTIQPPSFDDFAEILADARRQARTAGVRRSDVTAAVRAVRSGS